MSLFSEPNYWLKGESAQNFGDFLSEYLYRKLFLPIGVPGNEIRIIGSCIDDYFVDAAVRHNPGVVIFWGCGLRERKELSESARSSSRILSVRGPLSRSVLRLGDEIPIGDPGLLMPAVYTPKVLAEYQGKTLLVPHFNEQQSDRDLKNASGCDVVLRPNVENNILSINEFIDKLTSSDFILCGSLHAAIVAVAYGKPFGFFDSHNIDLPFKWEDFSASIGISCKFFENVLRAREYYKTAISDQLKIPALWPSLMVAPYAVRSEVLRKVFRIEYSRYGDAVFGETELRSTSEEIGENVRLTMKSAGSLRKVMENDIANLRQMVVERDASIQSLHDLQEEARTRTEDLEQNYEACLAKNSSLVDNLQVALDAVNSMKRSRSWRLTTPFRSIGAWLRSVSRLVSPRGRIRHIATGLLFLPAASVVYGGLLKAFTAWWSGEGVLGVTIRNQGIIRERLATRSPLTRRFVFSCYSLGTRLQRSGSGRRSVHNFVQVLRTEGLSGIRRRLVATAPGLIDLERPRQEGDSGIPSLPVAIARRVLVADYRVPRPDISAGERATVGILGDLCALGYEVFFLPSDMKPSLRYEEPLRESGVQVVTRESGYEYAAQFLERHGSEFGVFYLIRVDVAEMLLPAVHRVAPYAKVVFHAPDLYFLRETREAALHKDADAGRRAIQTRERELAIMKRSDHVVVVSPAEVHVIRELLPSISISVFPVLYAPVVKYPRSYLERKDIFFLGGFGHSPNVDAVQWFAAEVWPHVHRALPDVVFHIIGAEAPASVMALGELCGIDVMGFIPDLGPVLETLRVGVAPLQYGAGIKGKVAVTMGAGIPCVCTEIAAEGMGIEDGVHAIVVNDPIRFADAIVNVYEDSRVWSRLSEGGMSLVRKKYSAVANRSSLLEVLNQANALPISLFVDYCCSTSSLKIPSSDSEFGIDVSIIIPVYNKWQLTRACLNSVVQTSTASSIRYEIILADDGSTDETTSAADIFPNLRVIKTSTNVGFLRNCNNAAKYARGTFILLLNNDTVVLPGWLDALYRTITLDPTAAIVGSKLLYPDGLIQEAGASLFSDGTAINIGRGFNRYADVFNLRREVDYISGASILIRKSFWDSCGGFDERYKTAYCEDSDLSMTARALGMRVIYEPVSEVVHFEHQSYAEQAPSHNSSLQNHNIKILVDKWKDVLKRDHLSSGDWQLAASHSERSACLTTGTRRLNGKLDVLYFSPFPSHPPSHGNRATIMEFGQRFQRLGHRVHFVLLQSPENSEAGLSTMADIWDTFDVLPFKNPMVAEERGIPFDGWYEEGLGERVRVLCSKYNVDLVFCSYIFQSKILEYIPSYILKVIDTHDKMGDRYKMLRESGQPLEFFSCSPEEEGLYLRRADVIVARRDEEASYFGDISGGIATITIPHVEDPHFLNRRFASVESVGIVASANRINLLIVRDFLEEVDRRLSESDCPFTIHIAGRVRDMIELLPPGKREYFRRPWVSLHGFVPDIESFYKSVDIVVSPVLMGTGINVKTVQAMAFGMPLLTTICGIKGINSTDPLHHHQSLGSLVDSLFGLVDRPEGLDRLAKVSRSCYQDFFDVAIRSFVSLCTHPKLIEPPEVPTIERIGDQQHHPRIE